MKRNSKSSISKADSYQAIGEFWDTHDSMDYMIHTLPVQFEVDPQCRRYFPLEVGLTKKLGVIAQQRGIAVETLLNLWVQERLQKEFASRDKRKPREAGALRSSHRQLRQAV